METLFDTIYFSLYGACIIFSFVALLKKIPGLLYLRIMLLAGFSNELCGDLLNQYNIDRNVVHYIYIPLELLLLVAFYKAIFFHHLKICRMLFISAICYLAIAALIAHFYHHWKGFPSAMYLLCCIFNAFWLPMLLLKLPSALFMKNAVSPVIIIMSILFIFYVGVFVFNSMYNYLLVEESLTAQKLRFFINYNLNFFLFAGLSIGFLRSRFSKLKFKFWPGLIATNQT